jgi:hypothetical protein
MGRAIFCVLLVLISPAPWLWLDTAVLRHRSPVAGVGTMIGLKLKSKRGRQTAVVVASLVGWTAWVAISHPVLPNPYFLHIELAIVIGALSIILLPPVAIVLASSSDESGRLVELASRCLFPYRAIALLDANEIGWSTFFTKEDNLRTIEYANWRESVHRLAAMSRLVIVDARKATGPVCEEVRFMLHPSRLPKALFVTHENGSAPAIDAVGINSGTFSVIRCSQAALVQEIARFKLFRTLAPKWVFLGRVGTHEALRQIAERRLRAYRPHLLSMILAEPRPDYFGGSEAEFRKYIVELVLMNSEFAEENPPFDAIGSKPSPETMRFMTSQAKAIRLAIQNGRIDFVTGMLDDGCRATLIALRHP